MAGRGNLVRRRPSKPRPVPGGHPDMRDTKSGQRSGSQANAEAGAEAEPQDWPRSQTGDTIVGLRLTRMEPKL